MGLTFKKRDDFDKLLDELGVSTVDLIVEDDKKADNNEQKTDPFAKFLEPKIQKAEANKK